MFGTVTPFTLNNASVITGTAAQFEVLDVDGDAIDDFSLHIFAAPGLSAGDLIL